MFLWLIEDAEQSSAIRCGLCSDRPSLAVINKNSRTPAFIAIGWSSAFIAMAYGADVMSSHRIRFIKRLYDDTGHPHHCLQGVIDIRHARDAQRALEAAKIRFARMRKIRRWDTHAHNVEIHEIGARASSAARTD